MLICTHINIYPGKNAKPENILIASILAKKLRGVFSSASEIRILNGENYKKRTFVICNWTYLVCTLIVIVR
jgi:hypothetical protein